MSTSPAELLQAFVAGASRPCPPGEEESLARLLEEAVAELRGEKVEEAPSVTLDLPVAMSIPTPNGALPAA